MTPDAAKVPALEFALRGLSEAAHLLGARETATQISAGHAAFWAAALEEQLRPLPWYRGARDCDADGLVLPGLILARNAVTHGAVVVPTSAGLAYPLFANGTLDFGPPIWRSLDEILEHWSPHMLHKSDIQQQLSIYTAEVARHPLAEPVERAVRWFARLQGAGWQR